MRLYLSILLVMSSENNRLRHAVHEAAADKTIQSYPSLKNAVHELPHKCCKKGKENVGGCLRAMSPSELLSEFSCMLHDF